MMRQTLIAYFLFASVFLISAYNNAEKENMKKLADELLRNDEELDETAVDDEISDEETMQTLADEIASNDIDGNDNEEASDEISDEEDLDIKVNNDEEEEDRDVERKKDPLFFGRRRRRRSSRRRRSWFTRRRRCASAISRRRSANCYAKSNGCGGSGSKVPIPYKKTFKEACNKHDICYYCGQVQGWTRSECDRSMHNDFKTICSCKYKGWKALGKIPCYTSAKVMHLAVRIFGNKYFQKQSPAWCMNQCVVGKGSPKLRLK